MQASLRPIRTHEIILIHHLLQLKGMDPEQYPLPAQVDPYEADKMGSIGLGAQNAEYGGDLIQVKYVDSDGVDVIISLTQDTQGRLLDLDFWKVDFSKLLRYPNPDDLIENPYLIG